jgi:hypothetical protein
MAIPVKRLDTSVTFQKKLGAKRCNTATMPTNQVVALFADRALSPNLSGGATLAQLDESLSDMREWHTGAPIAATLKFSIGQRMVGVHQSGI